MAKPIPTIQKYMTSGTHFVGSDQTLAKAHEMMKAHAFRHLPVLSGGKLVGILTERDLHMMQAIKGVDPHQVKVEDAMSSSVYAVSPDAPLDEVDATMGQ